MDKTKQDLYNKLEYQICNDLGISQSDSSETAATNCVIIAEQYATLQKQEAEDYAALLESKIPKWVSVEDGLPEFHDMFSDRVLGYDIRMNTMKVVSLYKNFDGRYLGYNTTQHEYMMNVTHWMQLPTPPETIKNDNV